MPRVPARNAETYGQEMFTLKSTIASTVVRERKNLLCNFSISA